MGLLDPRGVLGHLKTGKDQLDNIDRSHGRFATSLTVVGLVLGAIIGWRIGEPVCPTTRFGTASIDCLSTPIQETQVLWAVMVAVVGGGILLGIALLINKMRRA